MKNPAALAKKLLVLGKPVLAAVSGGADSLAMMHFLHDQGFNLIVASFDHQLRGESAKSDVAFVRETCQRMNIPFITGTSDVKEYARENKLSIEEAARNVRYAFLFDQARKSNVQAVITGHTLDDQAETILMHFVRGAGIAGLKGIYAKSTLEVFDPSIALIRPILEWTREETEEYCKKYDLHPRQDITNTDIHFFRNRLRLQVIPLLKELNPNLVETLNRSAQVLQGEQQLLDALTNVHFDACLVANSACYFEFDAQKLAAIEQPLLKRILRKAALALNPGLRDVDKEAMDRVSLKKGVQIGGGLLTFIEEDNFYITNDISAIPAERYPQVEEVIAISDGVNRLSTMWEVDFTSPPKKQGEGELPSISNDGLMIALDQDQLIESLLVRKPISGDRFEPLGMANQTMKLADLFINLKIPKRYRANYPVLTHAGKVIWIPGLRRAEALKCTPNSKNIMMLRIKKNPADHEQGSK